MKKRSLILILAVAFGISAYQSNNSFTPSPGIYGGNGYTAPQITLQKDGTFLYKDLTNPKKEIETKGNYEVKENKLILSAYTSTNKIQNEWKIVNKGQCLKAKKNFAFYTLCTTFN